VHEIQLEAANAHARANPGMTLGARVASALDALERGTQLTQIIRACITLELSTRYSKVSASLHNTLQQSRSLQHIV
jgi:hypothetical protein